MTSIAIRGFGQCDERSFPAAPGLAAIGAITLKYVDQHHCGLALTIGNAAKAAKLAKLALSKGEL